MDFDDLISRYIDGELDSQAEAELHHRLSVSPEARSALRTHTALRDASRDTRILDTPSPELHAALFNRLQQEEGMARAAAAVVVPTEALAPARRDPIPSEMHNPGRRVRRRKTALWFALPMVLIATILASEFLLVDGGETRKLAESVQRNVSRPPAPTVQKAPSDLAAAPTTTSGEGVQPHAAEPSAAPSAPSHTSTAGPTSNTVVAEASGGSAEKPDLALAAPPAPIVTLDNSGTSTRPLPRTIARERRAAPTDDASSRLAERDEADYEMESMVNAGGALEDGRMLAAARSVDSRRSLENPVALMSNSDNRSALGGGRASTSADHSLTDSVVNVPFNSATAPPIPMNARSLGAQGFVQEGTSNAAVSIQEQTQSDRAVVFQQNYRANSNQISAPSTSLMQRSVTLADSTMESLVRKDTLRRVSKNAAKKAKNFRSRASRRALR